MNSILDLAKLILGSCDDGLIENVGDAIRGVVNSDVFDAATTIATALGVQAPTLLMVATGARVAREALNELDTPEDEEIAIGRLNTVVEMAATAEMQKRTGSGIGRYTAPIGAYQPVVFTPGAPRYEAPIVK